jgi:hypothetical protein
MAHPNFIGDGRTQLDGRELVFMGMGTVLLPAHEGSR